MNTKLRTNLFAIAAGLFFSCAGFAQELFVDHKPIAFAPLQKIEPSQTIGGYPILNLGNDLFIDGMKTVYAGSGGGDGSGRVPMGLISLIDARDNVFFANIIVHANLETSFSAADWMDEPCKKDTFLWKKSTGGNFSNINCATITYQTNFAQDYPTVVQARFTRYSASAKRLMYVVSINPVVFGIEKDTEPKWEASSWHKDRLENDPKKVEFVVHLSKWAEDVQKRMNDAFDKKPDAFSGIAPLADYF